MKQTKLFTIYKKGWDNGKTKIFFTKATYDKESGKRIFLDVKINKDLQARLDKEVEKIGGYPVTIVVDEYWLFNQEKTTNKRLVFKDYRELTKIEFDSNKQTEVSVDDLE